MTVKLIQCLDCTEQFMSTEASDTRCAKCQSKENVKQILATPEFPPPSEPEAFDRPIGGCVSHAQRPLAEIQEIDVPDMHGHPRFYEVIDDWAILHSKKAQAYEGSNPPYTNYIRAGDRWFGGGKAGAVKYAMMRLEEKIERIRNGLLGETDETGETMRDHFDDAGVIIGIARVLWEEGQKK